ncbi:MAG: type II toxin-antitoxin system HicA family toxin [Chthoniobacter sp.]|uniref:type II toxin-antitoxin system HicA family toxin n=1 Tax=Chthoniobacter sp. TaxID=2510640 RepID=UPI0032AAC6C8
MKQVTGRDLARAVQSCGWTLSRVKGSHHIFTKAGCRERIVIPIHGHQPLKIGLLKAQMKIAGLREEDL